MGRTIIGACVHSAVNPAAEFPVIVFTGNLIDIMTLKSGDRSHSEKSIELNSLLLRYIAKEQIERAKSPLGIVTLLRDNL
jgi:hypothetical protein